MKKTQIEVGMKRVADCHNLINRIAKVEDHQRVQSDPATADRLDDMKVKLTKAASRALDRVERLMGMTTQVHPQN